MASPLLSQPLEGLGPGGMLGQTHGWTDGQTYVRTDSRCVVQDFVPLRGRNPKTTQSQESELDSRKEYKDDSGTRVPRANLAHFSRE